MKRLRLISMLLALALLTALLSGCGSASSGTTANGSFDQTEAGASQMIGAGDTVTQDYATATEESQSDTDVSARPADAKLIYTGYLTLECTDLKAAMPGLEELVSDHGGYLERQEVYQQTGWQTADYTVRVPSEPVSYTHLGPGHRCDPSEGSCDLSQRNRLEVLKRQQKKAWRTNAMPSLCDGLHTHGGGQILHTVGRCV